MLFFLSAGLAKLDPEATNFAENFNVESLEAFVKTKKYVVVLFADVSQKSEKFAGDFRVLSERFVRQEVYFLRIQFDKSNEQAFSSLGVSQFPELRMYVYGFKKVFIGDLAKQTTADWINEIYTAYPHRIKDSSEVAPIDRHYFVYVAEAFFRANKVHIDVLSKLIHPLGIYFGLPDEEIEKVFGRKIEDEILAKQEYQGKVLSIPVEFDLSEKAAMIIENEFPDSVECDKSSFRMVTEFRIPTLIFFYSVENENLKREISEAWAGHKDHLMFMTVDTNINTPEVNFLKSFCGVESSEQLSILDVSAKTKVYSQNAPLSGLLAEIFLMNFAHGNLKPNAGSRRVKSSPKNMRAISLSDFNAVAKLRTKPILVIVYSKIFHDVDQVRSVWEAVSNHFEKSKAIMVCTSNVDFNHFTNINVARGPYAILVPPEGEVAEYTGEISSSSLIGFVVSKLDYLEYLDNQNDSDL